MIRISGRRAIDQAETLNIQLHKFADAVDGARAVTIAEARDIAAEDPSLIYADDATIACLEWSDEGQMEWAEAVAFAADLRDGWRLPTVSELRIVTDDAAWYWARESITRPYLVRCRGGIPHYGDVSNTPRVRLVRAASNP